MDSKLKQEEQRIDLKVLHHLNRDDHRKKLKRFRRTVSAVHAIVTNKLYRSKASSLEAYFREAWKISRAQVYRFLDCAWVLKQLDGFPSQPCRERLCRSLKRLAKNRTDIRKLWESVLEKVDNDHEAVTSTIITTIWAELLERNQVTGKPDPASDETGALDDHDRADIDDDESDSEADVVGAPQNAANLQGLQGENASSSWDKSADAARSQHEAANDSAPLTLEPAMDHSAVDPSRYQNGAPLAMYHPQYQNMSSRTLPNPSTLPPYNPAAAASLSWRATTLAPTSSGAATAAEPQGSNQLIRQRPNSLPTLADFSRFASAAWPQIPTPTTPNQDPFALFPAVAAQSKSNWTPSSGPPGDSSTRHSPSTPAPPAPVTDIPPSDISTCSNLLESFTRKGYALQPFVEGRWVEEPASQWRIAPIEDRRMRRFPVLLNYAMAGGIAGGPFVPRGMSGNAGLAGMVAGLASGQGPSSGQPQMQHHQHQAYGHVPTDTSVPPPHHMYIPANTTTSFTIPHQPTAHYATSAAQTQSQNAHYDYERLMSLPPYAMRTITSTGQEGSPKTSAHPSMPTPTLVSAPPPNALQTWMQTAVPDHAHAHAQHRGMSLHSVNMNLPVSMPVPAQAQSHGHGQSQAQDLQGSYPVEMRVGNGGGGW